MAIAFVQYNFGTSASGLTCSQSPPFSVTTTGNTLVVISIAYNSPTMPTVSGVAVNSGSATFTKVGGQAGISGSYGAIEVWAAPNITGGTSVTTTVTYTTATTAAADIYVIEISGAPTTLSIDGGSSNGKAGTAATACSTHSLTTTNASDFILAGFSPGGAMSSGQAGWTFLSIGTNTGAGVEYIVETATQSGLVATATQNSSAAYGSYIVAFANTAGATNVNATVAIAAKAVSGLTLNPQITKDATFFCSGVAAATFRCNLAIFGTVIIQGKATSASYKGQSVQLKGAAILGKATGTFLSFVTHNTSVAIRGTATSSRFNAGSVPTQVNATVHLFGFAANNTPIDQIFGRARMTLRSTIPVAQVTINGRATLTPVVRLTGNVSAALHGNAKLTLGGSVTGAGILSATLIINGRAIFTVLNPRVTKDAQVVIQAGNLIFIPVEAQVAIMGRGSVAVGPKVTKSPQILISGHATLVPNVTLGNTNNIFSGVHFAGRATGTFVIPPASVPATVQVSGRGTVTPSATNIVSLSATVAIRARANAPFAAFIVGGTFNNGVLHIAGRSVVTASQFTLVQPTSRISGQASMFLYPGETIRAFLNIHGIATFTPQVPKQLLQWSSVNVLQYKIWQYNMESMVRVLGTTWTTTSVGLSFQSVALELMSTEAGWGS